MGLHCIRSNWAMDLAMSQAEMLRPVAPADPLQPFVRKYVQVEVSAADLVPIESIDVIRSEPVGCPLPC